MIKKILLSFSIILQILSPSLAFGASGTQNFSLYAVNTIAGYGTILQISSNIKNEHVAIKVKKPDASIVNLESKTDNQGKAKVELESYDTQESGKYIAQAYVENKNILSKSTYFNVYPDQVSSIKSSINASQTVLQSNQKDQSTIKVTLLDQYGNAISGHAVQIVSSKSTDQISTISPGGLTNEYGTASFKVYSAKSGLSTLSAFDTTSNVTLENTIKIAFTDSRDYQNNNYLKDAGGDLTANIFDIAQAAQNGTLHHFEIAEMPQTIEAGANISFRITAQDESNQTVQNYTGKIHFSAEGDNANVKLPEDYTFTPTDLGTHLFNLSLSFPANGNYKIIATDLDNTLLKGEKSVTVGSGSKGNNQNVSGEKPTVETPAAGTYSQKNQTIGGSAPAGYTIKIYDNEQEIGSVQVDSNGHYSFQTADLSEGNHSTYVIALDANQTVKGTSDTVKFTIDTTAPIVDEIKITPDTNIKPDQTVTVDVTSEENLSQSALVFNTDIVPLNPSLDKPNHYSASLQAPKTTGVYPIDVIVVDQLGNEGSEKAIALLKVDSNLPSEVPPTTTEPTTQNPPPVTENKNNPSKVTGLISYGGDKKVTLVWDAANDEGQIKHYRLYYGTSPSDLKNYVDTKDASTTWYKPDLTNGTQYYFAVTAFDDAGNESPEKSEIVTGTPYTTEITALPKNTAQSLNYNYDAVDQLHGAALDSTFSAGVPPRMEPYGPEVMLLFPIAGLAALARKKWRKVS